MTQPVQRRFSRLRRIFRWCRIFVWLAILAIVVAGIYINTIGLPDFLKRPLLAKLRAEGVQVDFSRMRLRWYRGIVVDKATFTFLEHPLQPKFSSEETELDLDLRSLRDSRLKLNSVAVKKGTLLWPVSKTNHNALTVSNITARMQFRSSEEIDLNQFEANFADTKITLTGWVTNVSALRDWKLFQPEQTNAVQNGLEKFAVALEKIRLTGSPKMTLQFSGDAGDPRSFTGKLQFAAPQVETPWGNGTHFLLTAEQRAFSSEPANNFLRLKADSAETIWGSASNFDCVARLSFNSTNTDTFQTDLKLFAKQLRLKSGSAGSVDAMAHTTLSFTNLIPDALAGNMSFADAETRWGKAGSAQITFSLTTNTAPKIADESWAAWRHAEPFCLIWDGQLSKIKTPKMQAENLSCAGKWRAPDLQISNLNAELYGGKFAMTGELNVATREAHAKGSSDFDVQQTSPLLTPGGQRWLAKYSWEKPPKLDGELRGILPPWTNQETNWREDVLPTLMLNGHILIGRSMFHDIAANLVKADFSYSNLVWTVPNLRLVRPEGDADLQLVANERTHEYHSRIHSDIDPNAVRQLLTESNRQIFDDFQFTTPPVINLELHGQWNEIEKVSFSGDLAVNNFFFRSNSVDKFTCSLLLTNQALSINKMRIDRADKFISAEKVELNFILHKIFFTDVYGTDDPYLVTRLIGRQVAANIAPYQFAEPPTVRLSGNLSLTNIDDADMHFTVDGNKFQWKQFNADKISGRVDWVGRSLLVTNILASAYRGGTIEGGAYFDFTPVKGTAFLFDFTATNIDLQSAVSVLVLNGRTNHLEGLLRGQFAQDSGNTLDPKSWRGHGHAKLRDGLIWDVPIFGIFSPVLNALLPGSGNSRAREGSATFVMRDGIISSDDLEIRAAGLRLQYRGGVDFEKRVDARVKAELLRDTWIIGPIVSLALTPISKIFEYQVSGTLSDPKSEPVYIPNFLMMTLRPFHSLKEAFLPEKKETPTGSEPPAKQNP